MIFGSFASFRKWLQWQEFCAPLHCSRNTTFPAYYCSLKNHPCFMQELAFLDQNGDKDQSVCQVLHWVDSLLCSRPWVALRLLTVTSCCLLVYDNCSNVVTKLDQAHKISK